MDGVILGMPPADPTERANHCRAAETYMWRKAGESAAPDLSGGSKYGRQIPLNRAVGLWGGISGGGFAEVFFHNTKKVNTKEWVCALQAGALTTAIKSLSPVKPHGPWHVLCDNESFLTAKDASREYLRSNVILWQIPARSPDLNPVEKFWGWLRKQLQRRDLADMVSRRPVLGKHAYRARIRAVCRSARARRVAKNLAGGLKKVCREVLDKKGAATRG